MKKVNLNEEKNKILPVFLLILLLVGGSYAWFNYVKVGDKIHKGQVVCIVEAMKLMNEIECEFDGEIAEILVKDGEMVEYGKPLFKIK